MKLDPTMRNGTIFVTVIAVALDAGVASMIVLRPPRDAIEGVFCGICFTLCVVATFGAIDCCLKTWQTRSR